MQNEFVSLIPDSCSDLATGLDGFKREIGQICEGEDVSC